MNTINNKGFTLIELLAVFVILAVIAAITIPIVSKTILKSKSDTAKISAKSYEDAVNQALMEKELDGRKMPSGYYDVTSNGNLCLKTRLNDCGYELEVDAKNTRPTGGYVVISDSDVIWYELTINDKTILKGEYTPLKYFNFDSSTGTISAGANLDSDIDNLIIPNEINGVKVKHIDEFGFSDNTLKSVILPRYLESISSAAFYKNKLSSIVIPNKVKTIGNRAFQENSIESLEISSSVTNIGKMAFYDNHLSNIIIYNIKNNVTIDDTTFNYQLQGENFLESDIIWKD